MTKTKKSFQDRDTSFSLAERVELVAGAAFACVYAAVVFYLVALALFSDPEPVRFDIEVSEQRRVDGTVHLEFEIRNLGSISIAEVHVGAVGGGAMTGETVFDYIPAGSTRRGTIVFPADAAPSDPAIAVTSYRDP